jgi:hypothetical protein
MACNGRLAVSDAVGDDALLDASAGTGGRASQLDSAAAGAGGGTEQQYGGDAGTSTPSCSDGSRNGQESDIDCGGAACATCAASFSCARNSDCQSGFCRASLCVEPSCDDGLRNGDETGVDCGGSCGHCRTNTCNCATSPALSALSCDESQGYIEQNYVSALTPDGQTALYSVVYVLPNAPSLSRTFRWTATGLVAIGDGYPVALSDDGQTALYRAINGGLFWHGTAGADSAVPLNLQAQLSADGSHVLGSPVSGANELARWTPAGGLESVGALPAGSYWRVLALSADASAAVGWGYAPNGNGSVPLRWTATGGISDLGALPTGVTGARARGVSSDGTVVVGTVHYGLTLDPGDLFRWTESGGFSILGPNLNNEFPTLLVSSDGSVVVGTSPADTFGFRWTPRAVPSHCTRVGSTT